MRPLVSTATAIATQANAIQLRSCSSVARGCCATSTPASTPARAAETPMSSELKWDAMFQVGVARRIRPVPAATRGPNQRPAATIEMPRPKAPLRATQRRACHSPMPNTA